MSIRFELDASGLSELIAGFLNAPEMVEGGVKVSGEAAAYALIWEWGSARLTEPGPKTTWGTNPRGERVILTLTAPEGYIRVHHHEYQRFLEEEWASIDWMGLPPEEWDPALTAAMNRAMSRAAQLISYTAPIDTGTLRSSIELVENGDELLNDPAGSAFDLGVQ